MLVLSRKLNEQIVIGDGIVVTVVAIRGGQVRLGVDAPKDIPIFREELREGFQQKADGEDKPAAKSGTSGKE